jgi:hypothetical protein
LIEEWLDDFRNNNSKNTSANKNKIFYFVVGNKCDLTDNNNREVSIEEGQKFV